MTNIKNKHTAKQALELTELQLKQQIEAKRQERQEKLTAELNEWLKKNNCALTTSVPVHIQNQPLGIVLIAL